MIELAILSGKQAGVIWAARRFPVQIGRSERDALRLEEPGVWDQHALLELRSRDGFWLTTRVEASAVVKGEGVREVRLQNGDVFELGSVKLQFSLAPMLQRGLAWREWLTWFGIAAMCLIQIAIVYWLR